MLKKLRFSTSVYPVSIILTHINTIKNIVNIVKNIKYGVNIMEKKMMLKNEVFSTSVTVLAYTFS
jgi:hypothetical protein